MEVVISTNTAVRHLQILGTGILLAILLTSSQIGSTHARSLTGEDGFFPENLIKRNTWWSKKSLNVMDTIPHTSFETGNSEYSPCQETIEIYSCYVTKCVQSFVTCARQSGSEEVFGACKMLHKMCAGSCSKGSQLDDYIRL
ncbi:uncharacterized protein LOC128212975 [Mya arenaria]|uniref:uncharacterized protein LOC128212975 n=1 Tax=Mya arenaria TaxID=6604 RepID=UPI0022E6A7F4|nr:uncharacterized protein LOC128212975 [Mya arenaria]